MAKTGKKKNFCRQLRRAKKSPLSSHLLLDEEDDYSYESINKRSDEEETSASRNQENDSSSSGYVQPIFVIQEAVDQWIQDFYHASTEESPSYLSIFPEGKMKRWKKYICCCKN